jgi:N-acetyl-alpha-D-glucosaminyl L-malate synthase BshA
LSLSIGITCYPTFGGSGIIATEIGHALAARGHRVHFVCAGLPRRLDVSRENVFFHPVSARDYPVFPQVPYALALTSAMVSVAQSEGLDLLHAHYAVPHATSAWMAREVLDGRIRVVTTLHGTDITLVGADASYLPITRHSIARSDAVTAPSAFLRAETYDRFDIDPDRVPIEVIPNFVDTATWRPRQGRARPLIVELFGSDDVPVVVHVSNFRALKRVDRVVEIFARVAADRPARLLLVGEGPERAAAEERIAQLGLGDRTVVLDNRDRVEDLLRECDVFLLPSETESFGLAALEALAAGVPVVASAVGGLPEVVRDGETGFLVPADDVAGMAARVALLLDAPERRAEMGRTARADVLARFRAAPMVDLYEALYARVMDRR